MADREYSLDSIFATGPKCYQPRRGYRFSQDPVLLAHFFSPSPDEKILDLGCGCGIISLILAFRWPKIQLTAVELQPALADLARRNVRLNNYEERITVLETNLNRLAEGSSPGQFQRVVCNPPYYPTGSGRLSPNPEIAAARHEILTTLAEIIQTAAALLEKGGRADLIYPASRSTPLLAALRAVGLTPRRSRLVHSSPGTPAGLIMVEAVKAAAAELRELPPLFIRKCRGGELRPEVKGYYLTESGCANLTQV